MTELHIEEILEFIDRRWESDANWYDGNCYWFAHILCTRFPFLDIYYYPADGHFVAGKENYFFDWGGRCGTREFNTWPGNPILLSKIKEMDEAWYNRLMRDCRD